MYSHLNTQPQLQNYNPMEAIRINGKEEVNRGFNGGKEDDEEGVGGGDESVKIKEDDDVWKVEVEEGQGPAMVYGERWLRKIPVNTDSTGSFSIKSAGDPLCSSRAPSSACNFLQATSHTYLLKENS